MTQRKPSVLASIPASAWSALAIGQLLIVGGALALALPEQAGALLGQAPSVADGLIMILGGLVAELPFVLALIRGAREMAGRGDGPQA